MAPHETHLSSFLLSIVSACILISSFSSSVLAMGSLASDQQTLLLIKSSLEKLKPTISSLLKDWELNSSSPCGWSRITCNTVSWLDNQTRVIAVNLSSLAINDTLPTGFSNLEALSNLNLSNNYFRDSISHYNIANCTHLTSLDLSSNCLSTIATDNQGLKNLINLQYLNLGGNLINSSITLALPYKCGQLLFLNLSHNAFYGDLSQSYSWQDCSSLQTLDLSYTNFLAGSSIPMNLTSLPSLQRLELNNNQLVGTIPNSICSTNSSSLLYLDLSENHLHGTLPLSLFNCLSLYHLDLTSNNLTGSIPSQVGNMSSLEVLDLAQNEFTGTLPAELGSLTNLKAFMAGSNSLTGSIPSQLTSCKSLNFLDLDNNSLNGSLPDFLGDMISLQYVVLHSNAFSGPIPLELFNPLSNIKLLDLSNNSLSRSIPHQLANLSSLQFLLLAQNSFSGEIPSELGSINGLQFLDLSSNHLTGRIPPSLGQLQHLLWLMLAFNNLTGQIPPQLGNCTSLLWLNLKSNSLSGQLPPELASMGQDPSKTFNLNAKNLNPPAALGECNMVKRWVPENYPPYSFVYTILDRDTCKSFWLGLLTRSPLGPACSEKPKDKGYIQVSDNKLTGPILHNFQANRTTFLLLSLNMFSGSLPGGLGNLPLLSLNVSHNMLGGSIPESLADNKCLTLLDLSNNNLSGSIPSSLGSLGQLTTFNVSFNPYLNGPIPSDGQFGTFSNQSYLNDSLLCLEPLAGMKQDGINASGLPFCSSDSNEGQGATHGRQSKLLKSVFLLIIGILSCSTIVFCWGMGVYVVLKWPMKTVEGGSTKYVDDDDDDEFRQCNSTVCLFKLGGNNGGSRSPDMEKKFTYADILLATDNFSADNVIGCGGFGEVYKAKLRDGSMVAIKKLIQSGSQGEREFIAEMETIGTLAHENLVPLLACCIFGSEKLLIYKWVSNGSLDDWLHGDNYQGLAEISLNWQIRVKIAWGCAKALVYLHHDCSPAFIIHRDMKASNVLLDGDFNGYVTDFGLARELHPGYSHVSTIIAGTLGYVPPEYCQTWRATTKGDVYSFGVVMLELLTGKPPVDLLHNDGCDGSLVDWVRLLATESRGSDAWHPVVKRTAAGREQEVVRFMTLALACTRDLPGQRPSMKEVAHALEEMQKSHHT